ncbi:DUF2470 domain-containing protein [Streptomyces sp. NPDC101393]|uniref:DUF2470 domain-containing protein n=1 Tax=Streptomyces sp. NPDC101393 TaxID=3366141 RepID=UPI0037FD5AB7
MRILTRAPAQPTSAERIRTVLAAAESMTLVTEEHSTEVSRLNGPDLTQHIHLHPLAEDHGTHPRHSARGRTAATLEFTDVSPAPVRDRVRARVTVMGWLTPPPAPGHGQGPLDGARHRPGRPASATGPCMEFARAVLHTPTLKASVDLHELMTATADPLATYEATLLTHLIDDHADLVTLLMRLVEPRLVQGVHRALPLALDRYGVTLRLEYARGHHDVRLPFPSPLTDVDQFGIQIQALRSAARRCSHRGRLLSDS